MNSFKPLIITILGQTASGKSALAIKLAQKLNGVVISADSQQIYKQAKIGTNQPLGKWRKTNNKWLRITDHKKLYFVNNIPHFFIDQLSLNKQYSAALFQSRANLLCRRLSTAGFLPIIVGGTGLYISALVENYEFPKGKPNLKLRIKLNKLSTTNLQRKLRGLDAATWEVIDKSNRRRLVRALEYIITTGESFYESQQKKLRPNTLIIGLKKNKKALRQAIVKRTDKMFHEGLVNEVKFLQKKYPHSPLLHSIGYREVVDYLKGKITQAECREQIINHTWQYARRQLTWFKKIPNVKWVNNYQKIQKIIKDFLKNYSTIN